MISGFVKLNRSIKDWRWYHNPNTFRLFVHLILSANIQDAPFENTVIKRGQMVTSYSSLSSELRLSKKEVRTALGHLKQTGEIKATAEGQYTVITVLNYDLYQEKKAKSGLRSGAQNGAQQGAQQGAHQETNEKPLPTRKNERPKNEKGTPSGTDRGRARAQQGQQYKKNKNIYIDIDYIKEIYKEKAGIDPTESFLSAMNGFAEMRQTILKKPLTNRAASLIMSKLFSFAPESVDAKVSILDQSTIHNWQGVYPLKDDYAKGGVENATDVRNDNQSASASSMSTIL